jgi:hypothetical protein
MVDPGIARLGHLIDVMAARDPWISEFTEKMPGNLKRFAELDCPRIGSHVAEDGFDVAGHDAR